MKQAKSDFNARKPEKIIIDKQIINNASQCHNHFACLKNNGHECCKVTYCVNGKVHFIEGAKNKVCNYKIFFGSSFFCSCPVRKELYNKYSL